MTDSIDTLRDYIPERHGEQGVDAAIHGAIEGTTEIHEVFCNPPGGSWTEFDIIHPPDGIVSRWDHIPRRPPRVKRPDQVFQYVDEDTLSLLTIESKYDKSDLTEDIGSRLVGYFEGHENYTGLRERPCWHKQDSRGKWKVVPEDASDDERYWFRDYPDVEYWSGFMFANSPIGLNDTSEITVALDDTLSDSDVDVALSVSWVDEHQYPKLYLKGTDEFRKSAISTALQETLEAHNSDIETL
ncbi:hypothetical protein [Haloplanus halophilus]|uniref:hypothetical protein n=1 Tax=Haloplanus halophilus TaxID=2949993 RepID=UPI00203C7E34|nr:hypothetical protein [Haloplanus sp. GDY1]